jgi:hypothetical protein
MRARLSAVVLVVVVAGLAGCAGRSGGDNNTPSDPPTGHDRWTSCAAVASAGQGGRPGADATALARLSEEFRPASVVVCDVHPQPTGRGGEDLVEVEGRAQEIAVLLTALRLPDQPRTRGACTAELPVVPWFALLDTDGRWVRPGVPVDACGKIRVEVRDAVRALALSTVATRKLGEITSDQAAAAGCSQTWADMMSVELRLNPNARPGPGAIPWVGAAVLRLCVYRVPLREQGSDKPAGDFEYGGVLDRQRRAAVEKSLLAAGPARTCSTPASRFALLLADDRGGPVYVELDGCQRIMIDVPRSAVVLAQADAILINLLGTG